MKTEQCTNFKHLWGNRRQSVYMYIFSAGLITTGEWNRWWWGRGGGGSRLWPPFHPSSSRGRLRIWGYEPSPSFAPTRTTMEKARVYWSQIHERTISLRFLGIILRVLRLEFSVYNVYVYITNQCPITFSSGGREEIRAKLLRLLSQWRPRNRPLE